MLPRVKKGLNDYVVYDLNGIESAIDKISMMMINSNQHENIGLASISLEGINGVWHHMLFDITGKITLADYIKHNISQEDFRQMLLNLITTIEKLDEYMISANQVLLDIEYVYINPVNHSVSFICIALQEWEQSDKLYDFFSEVIMKSKTAYTNGIDYWHKAFDIVRGHEGVFSLCNLKITVMPISESENNLSSPQQDTAGIKTIQPSSPVIQVPEEEPVPSPTEEKEEEKKNGILNFFVSKKKKSSEPTGYQGGLAGLIRGKKLEKASPVLSEQPPEAKEQPLSGRLPFGQSHINFGGTAVLNDGMANPRNGSQMPASSPNHLPETETGGTVLLNSEKDNKPLETTVLLMSKEDDDTVLMEEKNACLIRIKNQEQIFLNKPIFLIGRNRNDLDYDVQDNLHIGHRHANIKKQGTSYFIIDLNSTNHTYVNGAKIQSSTETELTDGDIVRLADEEFEFKLI